MLISYNLYTDWMIVKEKLMSEPGLDPDFLDLHVCQYNVQDKISIEIFKLLLTNDAYQCLTYSVTVI